MGEGDHRDSKAPGAVTESGALTRRRMGVLRWRRRLAMTMFVTALPAYLMAFHLISPRVANWTVALWLVVYAVAQFAIGVFRCPNCNRRPYRYWAMGQRSRRCRECGLALE